ncbi:MAG: class I SAM-dependent methyltransferase [Paludibacteraceae bacterium]|nr:class I SAM-dependent methyltransferase [Paludibacteraceae bacterium]
MSKIHQIGAFIRHFLTAWNTSGEAIHSPYLFRLVRFVLRDENAYYCFRDIERRRELLLACEDSLDVVDYGSAGSPEGLHVQRRVCDIAKNHLESARVGQVLFRIVNFLHEEEKRPLNILELGTSLGINTAYLASPDSRNKVVTMEGSEAVLRVAQGVWKMLKLENIEWIQGNIDDTLYNIYSVQNSDVSVQSSEAKDERIDLAYVDANHTYEATMRYADFLLNRLTEKGILVLDDIHYSEQMERAWSELKADPRVTTSMDLYHVGLLFVDTHYLKRHYRIRI